jgi:hypothetical protein
MINRSAQLTGQGWVSATVIPFQWHHRDCAVDWGDSEDDSGLEYGTYTQADSLGHYSS